MEQQDANWRRRRRCETYRILKIDRPLLKVEERRTNQVEVQFQRAGLNVLRQPQILPKEKGVEPEMNQRDQYSRRL